MKNIKDSKYILIALVLSLFFSLMTSVATAQETEQQEQDSEILLELERATQLADSELRYQILDEVERLIDTFEAAASEIRYEINQIPANENIDKTLIDQLLSSADMLEMQIDLMNQEKDKLMDPDQEIPEVLLNLINLTPNDDENYNQDPSIDHELQKAVNTLQKTMEMASSFIKNMENTRTDIIQKSY